MPKHTLTEVFGANATQTAESITIQKADLTTLTANANNDGSTILSAILIKAQAIMSQTAYDADSDKSIYLADGFSSFTTRGANNDPYRVDQIVVNLAKPDTGSTLDADDY